MNIPKVKKVTQSPDEFIASGEEPMPILEAWIPAIDSNWIDIGNEHAQRSKDQVNGWIHTDNIAILAGCGTSMRGSGPSGPSMGSFFSHAQSLPNFEKIRTDIGYAADGTNIEEFLSRCEMLQQINTSSELDTFLTSMKEHIASQCRNFITSGFPLTCHESLLRKLGNRSERQSRLKIFTTNYDLCFEQAASSAGYVVIDGFGFSFPRQFASNYFQLELVHNNKSEQSFRRYERLLQLYKLHGSINWEETNGMIQQAEMPADPCLIYPASSKFRSSYRQPYLEMMSHYLSTLRDGSLTLIVVGFGFQDEHLNAPILAALRSNNEFRLIIVSPTLKNDLEKKNCVFEELGLWLTRRDHRIMAINGTLEDLANWLPGNPKPSQAEILEQTVRSIATGREHG